MARKKKQTKIKIDPKQKGSFTKWCKSHGYGGVNQKCVNAAKNKGGRVAKKAVFAQNFALRKKKKK